LMRCRNCGSTNRVPLDKLEAGRQPVCGRCKTPLPVGATAGGGRRLPVTDASFGADVERSPVPVLLDAWAPWCGPCRMIAPVVDQLATELAGRARVAKLNIDENPVTAQRLDVRSIPMLLVFKGGREVDRIVGVQPKSEIARRVERAIAWLSSRAPSRGPQRRLEGAAHDICAPVMRCSVLKIPSAPGLTPTGDT